MPTVTKTLITDLRSKAQALGQEALVVSAAISANKPTAELMNAKKDYLLAQKQFKDAIALLQARVNDKKKSMNPFRKLSLPKAEKALKKADAALAIATSLYNTK